MRAAAVAAALAAALAAAEGDPRLETAPVSVPPPSVVGGGVVAVEASVREGRVASVRRLSGEAGLLGRLEDDVSRWRFELLDTEAPFLVVGLYRPPELLLASPPALGPIPPGPESLPVPRHVEVPAYPADALGDGVVVLEVGIDAAGAVSAVRTVEAVTGFEDAARDAARLWRFRPAGAPGDPIRSRAALVFVFREPVTDAPPTR